MDINIYQSHHAGTAQQGSALILAMLVMLVMSIVIMGMATDSDLDLKISRNLEMQKEAFNNAETGIALASEVLRESGMINWTENNDDDSTSSVYLSDYYRLEINSDLENIYNDGGEIEVYFEEDGNSEQIAEIVVSVVDEDEGLFHLESEGFIEYQDTQSKIAALFLPFKPFSAGMVGCDEIDFDGTAYTAETDVFSGGSVYDYDNVTGEVYENQDMICDPLGVEEMVSNSDPEPGIDGENKDVNGEYLPEDFYDYERNGYAYKFGNLNIEKDFVITEDLGEVVLYVDEDLTIDGEMRIEEGTHLIIYVEGNINVTGNAEVNPDDDELSGFPEDLIIYSSNSSEDEVGVTIGLTPEFNGAIFAPLTKVEFSGNPKLRGAIRGKTVRDAGNVTFEYDPMLQNWIEDYPGGYFLTNWNSLQE